MVNPIALRTAKTPVLSAVGLSIFAICLIHELLMHAAKILIRLHGYAVRSKAVWLALLASPLLYDRVQTLLTFYPAMQLHKKNKTLDTLNLI